MKNASTEKTKYTMTKNTEQTKNMTVFFFRALCHGILCFFLLMLFHGENCETKSPFFGFFQKSQNRRFCFAIFSMKNASTEKTKYTTTKSTEKRIKCTSPIFNFRNFVTEIFAKHFQKFSIF